MPVAKETILEINVDALAQNYRYITSKVPKNAKIMAVVKAFGYGSSATIVAKELVSFGVNYFAVAYAHEGEALRNDAIETPILVLHPIPANFELIIDRCLEPSIYSPKVLKEFIAFAEKKQQQNYPIHLKFNTGLNRLGFWENDLSWILDQLATTTAVKVKSVFSHLAASEDASESEFTNNQLESFKKITSTLCKKLPYQPLLHTLNTSGVLNYPNHAYDMVRTGIGLYGFGNDSEENQQLTPIATLKTIISQIHKIEPGESVGYNRAYKAEGYQITATLPIGHADGISRAFGNGIGWATIHGQKAPIIGNVCMDMIMVNVTGIDCKEGDEVIIFGENPTAETLAEAIGTIPYELITAISQRVKRVVHRK